MQLQLEKDWQTAGEPDAYVFEELEAIYRALGDNEKANKYLKSKDA